MSAILGHHCYPGCYAAAPPTALPTTGLRARHPTPPHPTPHPGALPPPLEGLSAHGAYPPPPSATNVTLCEALRCLLPRVPPCPPCSPTLGARLGKHCPPIYPYPPLLSAASRSRQQRLPSGVECMLQHTTPWHTHTRAHPGAPIRAARPGHPHFLPAGQLGWCCTPSTFKVPGGGRVPLSGVGVYSPQDSRGGSEGATRARGCHTGTPLGDAEGLETTHDAGSKNEVLLIERSTHAKGGPVCEGPSKQVGDWVAPHLTCVAMVPLVELSVTQSTPLPLWHPPVPAPPG